MKIKGQVSVFLDEYEGHDQTAEELEEQRLREAKLQNQKDLDRREELLTQIRKRPDLVENLGLHEVPTNAEIIRRFRNVENPRDMLRACGLETDEALELSELVPYALRATGPPPMLSWFSRPGGVCIACSAALLAPTALLVWLPFWLLAKSKEGWREGTCNIVGFYKQNCDDPACTFNIEIREILEGGSFKQFQASDWAMPLVRDPKNEPRVKLAVDAFRCCDPDRDLNCCNRYNEKLILFCDNYKVFDDPDGNPCPEGDWPCLFKAGPMEGEEGEQVSEAIAYEPPAVLGLIIGAVFFFTCSILAGIFGVCKKTRCCGLKPKFIRYREKLMQAMKFGLSYFSGPAAPVPDEFGGLQVGTEKRRASAQKFRPSKFNAASLRTSFAVRADEEAQKEADEEQPNAQPPPYPPPDSERQDVEPPEEEPEEMPGPDEPGLGEDRVQSKNSRHGSRISLSTFWKPTMVEMKVTKRKTQILDNDYNVNKDVHPAFRTGDISHCVAAPSIEEAKIPIIEPLPAAVAARRQFEVRRQNNARMVRPASAPAGARNPQAVSEGRRPGRAAAAWVMEANCRGRDHGDRDGPRRSESGAQSHASSRQSGPSSWDPPDASKRPESAMSYRPESAMSTAATSRRPESAPSRRSESAPSTRPESGISRRPESAPSRRPETPTFQIRRPESAVQASGASSRQASKPLESALKRPKSGTGRPQSAVQFQRGDSLRF